MLLPEWLLSLLVTLPAALVPPRVETAEERKTQLCIKLVVLGVALVFVGVFVVGSYFKATRKISRFPPERESRGSGRPGRSARPPWQR